MPLFKVVPSDRSKIVLVAAKTLVEVVENAIKKFNLERGEYKVLLNEDGAEVDDDEVLMALTENHTGCVTFMILLEGQEWKCPTVMSEGLSTKTSVGAPLPNATADGTSGNASEVTGAESTAVNSTSANSIEASIGLNLWQRFPQRLITDCNKGVQPDLSDRRSMIGIIADYLVHELKDTTCQSSERIAKNLTNKYPKSFSDMIDGRIVGAGMETLRTQIYNAVHYKIEAIRRRSVDRSRDSDENESNDAANTRRPTSRTTDEYGCMEYQPILPPSESTKSQKDKTTELRQLFESERGSEDDQKILDLMNDTYPSQRTAINSSKADMCQVLREWPYLTQSQFLNAHAARLLGKPIIEVWEKSLAEKVPACTKYLKFIYKTDRRKSTAAQTVLNKAMELFKEAKEATTAGRNSIANIGIIVPIIVNQFQEKADDLFRWIAMDVEVETVKPQIPAHPVLIVQGRSLYDDEAKHFVIIERSTFIKANGLFDGMLTLVMAYFVFRYEYAPGVCKTLEFLQRFLLEINPATGQKKGGKKRKTVSFDPKVFALIKAIEAFKTNIEEL